ncbi:DUF2177 family protein [soil metagenome]
MNISHFLKVFAAAYPLFILMDITWIGLIMNNAYKASIGGLLRTASNGQMAPHIPASLLVWAFIVFGAILFVLPYAKNASLLGQFGWGALYGLVLYGMYDFTNFAILAQWPLGITLIDLGWGMLVNGLFAVILVWLNRLF